MAMNSDFNGRSAAAIPATLREHLRRKKIPKLDALRALSALVVVLYHMGFAFIPAGTGVLMFFVISGFLITWLLLEEVDVTGTVCLRRFYFRRTFRIFPAFYVFWFLSVGALVIKNSRILWGQAIATFFYLGNYYQATHHYPESALSHAWSLGVEEQYYLLWPAVVLLLRTNPRRLLKFTCTAIMAVWIYRDVLQVAGAPEAYIYTAFDTRIDHLLIGCVVAISLKHGYFSRFWRFVCAKPAYMLVPAISLLLSITAAWYFGTIYRNTTGFILDPLLSGLLIVQLLATRSRWLGWMDSPLLTYLGTISYSTYLYHKWAGTLVHMAIDARPAVLVLGGIATTYVIASLSYYAVERPFLRLRVRMENRSARKSIALAGTG
jgi:peptidoglycan/LPS O-acetylase OafA/YrhL